MAVFDKKALFCECKWRNAQTDMPVLEKLLERSMMFPHPEKHYCLFSKSGFTLRAMEYGRSHGMRLLSFEEMNAASSSPADPK